MAETRKLNAHRIMVELMENGMEAEKRKQPEFFDLAERLRLATDPEEVTRLGDQIGLMLFGSWCPAFRLRTIGNLHQPFSENVPAL